MGLHSVDLVEVGTPVQGPHGVLGRITSSVLSPLLGGALSLAMLDPPPDSSEKVRAGASGPWLTITALPIEQ